MFYCIICSHAVEWYCPPTLLDTQKAPHIVRSIRTRIPDPNRCTKRDTLQYLIPEYHPNRTSFLTPITQKLSKSDLAKKQLVVTIIVEPDKPTPTVHKPSHKSNPKDHPFLSKKGEIGTSEQLNFLQIEAPPPLFYCLLGTPDL